MSLLHPRIKGDPQGGVKSMTIYSSVFLFASFFLRNDSPIHNQYQDNICGMITLHHHSVNQQPKPQYRYETGFCRFRL
jgi:hypothetical protein